MNDLSINRLGNESNSREIGSQVGRMNTQRAMENQNLSKMPKANWKIIKIQACGYMDLVNWVQGASRHQPSL